MLFYQDEKQRLIEELQEAVDSARRRSLGNIKFIGELFKLKMLTEVIMHDCIVKLLKNHDEESLECLCRLLSTIGKDLDFEKAKVHSPHSTAVQMYLCVARSNLIYQAQIYYLSSAANGPVFQSDGENHKRKEDHIQDPLYAARCVGFEMGMRMHTHYAIID